MSSENSILESAASTASVRTALDSNTPQPLPAEHIGSSPARSQPHTPSNSAHNVALNSQSSAAGNSPAKISSPLRSRASSSAHNHSPNTLDARRQALDKLQQTPGPIVPAKDPDFLTSLAAQERRVLEIKEELHKAELELSRLKRLWMSHESTIRKPEDGARLQQMRPMSGSVAKRPDKDDTNGSSAWMYEEMERRKALMSQSKRSSRRIFNGSRNPRPLSLAPQATLRHFSTNALPDPTESRRSFDDMPPERGRGAPTSFFRSPSSSPRRQSLYLSTGKQLATEWREGLWTFFEDLKHATVGDEPRLHAAISNTGSRKRNTMFSQPRSNGQSRSSASIQARSESKINQPKQISHVNGVMDASGAFWEENVLDEADEFPTPPTVKPTPIRPKPRKQTPSIHTQPLDGESWEQWESPENKQPSSAHSSNLSHSRNTSPTPSASTPASSTTHSTEATPRQSTGPVKQRDAIPWPALAKISAGQLRRTASNLMDEWEKSLTADSETGDGSSQAPPRQRDFESSPSPIEHITLA